jgi:hypothetical protein
VWRINNRAKIKIHSWQLAFSNWLLDFGFADLEFGTWNLEFFSGMPLPSHMPLAHGSRFSLQVLAPRTSHRGCGLSVAIAHADRVLVLYSDQGIFTLVMIPYPTRSRLID